MSDAFTVEIDKAAFHADIKNLLEGTALWEQIQGKLVLDWSQPGESAKTLASLVSNVIAAVEVAKSHIIEMQDPDGSKGLKLDGKTALEAAVTALDNALVFKGCIGTLVDMVDKPILIFIIEAAFAARQGSNWLMVAKTIIGVL